MTNNKLEDTILRSLRKITRAIDLYSKKLARECKLTGPQLVCLRQINNNQTIAPGELAKEVSLSQATITGILDRLAARNLINRERSQTDRRKLIISLTAEGKELVSKVPSPLQERFSAKLSELPEENQLIIKIILQQIVSMMDAEKIDAAPVLTSGEINTLTTNTYPEQK